VFDVVPIISLSELDNIVLYDPDIPADWDDTTALFPPVIDPKEDVITADFSPTIVGVSDAITDDSIALMLIVPVELSEVGPSIT
jgi:hypothetical protein